MLHMLFLVSLEQFCWKIMDAAEIIKSFSSSSGFPRKVDFSSLFIDLTLIQKVVSEFVAVPYISL